MSRVVAIVQARLGSSRLPGKVLLDIAGRPMLTHVLDRARAIPGVDEVVLATTTAAADAELAAFGGRCGVRVHRGSEDDVLDRYYGAAQAASADVVIRITADCPLLDSNVSGAVVAAYRAGGADYVSNFHPRWYPDGLDTEVFGFAALERAWREAALPSEREHVTPFIWKRPERFRLQAVVAAADYSSYRFTVDEPRDLAFMRAVFAHLPPDAMQVGFEEIVDLLVRHPEIVALNADIPTNEGYERSLVRDAAGH